MVLHLIQGNLVEARELLSKCLPVFESQGYNWGVTRCCILLAMVEMDDGRLNAAEESLSTALEHLSRYRWASHFIEVMAVSALFLEKSGRREEAVHPAVISVAYGPLPVYLMERIMGLLPDPLLCRSSGRHTEPERDEIDEAIRWVRKALKRNESSQRG